MSQAQGGEDQQAITLLREQGKIIRRRAISILFTALYWPAQEASLQDKTPQVSQLQTHSPAPCPSRAENMSRETKNSTLNKPGSGSR